MTGDTGKIEHPDTDTLARLRLTSRNHRTWLQTGIRVPTSTPRPTAGRPGTRPAQIRECMYRGDHVDTQRCSSCRGTVELKVFTCDVHGRCTLVKATPGAACCANCTEYAPPTRMEG